MRYRKQLLIDCIDGRWRVEFHRIDSYGVRMLIVGRVRFVWMWPVPPSPTRWTP